MTTERYDYARAISDARALRRMIPLRWIVRPRGSSRGGYEIELVDTETAKRLSLHNSGDARALIAAYAEGLAG